MYNFARQEQVKFYFIFYRQTDKLQFYVYLLQYIKREVHASKVQDNDLEITLNMKCVCMRFYADSFDKFKKLNPYCP